MSQAVTAELADWSRYGAVSWPTLLIGNGLSINIWDGFAYDSLFEQATLHLPAREMFAELNTTNFEVALECLHHADLALRALREDRDRVTQTYREVKDALFAAVATSHVPWDGFSSAQHTAIATTLDKHRSVFTTNYDLCLYWSQLESDAEVAIVDFFWHPDGTFDPADTDVWEPASTAIYYLHGGVHLWQDDSTGGNGKWLSADSMRTLLDVGDNYNVSGPRQPLFVSEGTSKDKIREIQRSPYLAFCRGELLANAENLVIFGHSLGRQDRHIVEAVRAGSPRKIAVSLYPSSDSKHIIAEKARIQDILQPNEVLFFDSTTHPLGNTSLRVS